MRKMEPGGRRGTKPSHGIRGQWLIAFPAWGDRCVDVLIRASLPAAMMSLDAAGIVYEFLIYTDQAERIQNVLPDNVARRIMAVPGPDKAFESMSNCHRHAMEAASIHDRVLLLTADMVISREVVTTAEAFINQGKHLICCVAPRTIDQPFVPVGASGRELLTWAWEHKHRMTRECTWPNGTSYDVWRMYFENGDEVAARAFLPHPLVVLPKGRRLNFRPTIDVNLANNFSMSVTHMITQPEEGAAIELSPPDKEFLVTETMRTRYQTKGPSIPAFIRQINERHRMFWSKKVIIKGSGGDCGDGEVVQRMLLG